MLRARSAEARQKGVTLHVWVAVGREFAIPEELEPGRSDEEKGKLSAFHFVRFAFPPEAIRAFAQAEAFLVVDHPAARARTRLAEETKTALHGDLCG